MKKNKFLFHREVLLTTLFTYFLILLLGLIFYNTSFLNPISAAFKDFQYTDVYFSSYKTKNNQVSDDIVLINIAEYKRADIVQMLPIVESFEPGVMALDITFSELKNEATDTFFRDFIKNTSIPLVLVSQIEYQADGSTSMFQSNSFFNVSDKEGFGNFLATENETVRYVSTEFEGQESFTAKILKQYNLEAYNDLQNRAHKSEVINYSGSEFLSFNLKEITSINANLDVLKDKIVLIGYMGLEDGTQTLKDAHLTPLNKSFAGFALPDKYGVEIHADILTMFLERSYISEIPKFISKWIIGFLITLLHMYLFLYFLRIIPLGFHAVTKTIQILSFGLLFFLSLAIFHIFHLKIEPSLMFIAVLLSVDAISFFETIMLWLNKKTGMDTYFKHLHK